MDNLSIISHWLTRLGCVRYAFRCWKRGEKGESPLDFDDSLIEETYVKISVHAVAFAAAAALGTGAACAQYAASILNPPGSSVSRAWGAYNGSQVGQAGGISIQTAALWSGTPASAIPLGPTGWTSFAYGIGGNQQVGLGSGAGTNFAFHALLWTGTAASMVDLNPTGYDVSAGFATDGTFQAGQATSGGVIHAMRWSGSAASAVDLNPAGFTESHAYGAWAGGQVGVGTVGGASHALLWAGSPESAVDLNGTLDGSIAYAMDATRQVGSGSSVATGSLNHAMVWSGTPASMVDLNPAGFSESIADGIGNGIIAGYGSGSATNNKVHALAWQGTTAIDLHSFLPAGYSSSYAYGVDPITGQIVGEAVNSSLNRSIAFMWTPVPEPSTWAAAAISILVLGRRRRKA